MVPEAADRSLLFVTGVGSGSWIYDQFRAHFADRYHTGSATITGLSESAPAGGGIVQRATSGLRHAIRQRAGPVVVIAHSLGCALVLAIACDRPPSNLAGIVLLDGAPRWCSGAIRSEAHRNIERDVAMLIPGNSVTETAAALRRWACEMVTSPGDRERLSDDFGKADPADLRAVLSDARKLQTILDPSQLTLPVMVLAACAGTADCTEVTAEFRARLAGARDVSVVPIRGSRHFVMLDRPLETFAATRLFLQSERLWAALGKRERAG